MSLAFLLFKRVSRMTCLLCGSYWQDILVPLQVLGIRQIYRFKKFGQHQVGLIQWKSHLGTSYSNCWKPRIKRKVLKTSRGKKHSMKKTMTRMVINFSSEKMEYWGNGVMFLNADRKKSSTRIFMFNKIILQKWKLKTFQNVKPGGICC